MISPDFRARWGRLADTNTPIFFLFLTLSGVLTLGFSAFFFEAMSPYETEGVPENAEVVARSRGKRRVRGFFEDVYTLRYHYRDTAGREHEGSGEVHRDTWFRYNRRSRLPIRYLRGRPDQSHPAIDPAWKYRPSLVFTSGLGSTMLLGAIAVAVRGWARAGRSEPPHGGHGSGPDLRKPRRRKGPKGRRRS